MSEFLDYDTLEELKKKAVEAELFDPDKRLELFFRIRHLRGKVPTSASLAGQLRQDLNFLNQTPAKDGPPPLLIWLQNARPLVADTDQQDFFEALLAEKAGRPGGAKLPAAEKVHNEAVLFALDDMLPSGYLAMGFEASRSVARLRTPRFDGGARHPSTAYWGTGWLLAPDLLITNHHVFNARGEGEPPAGAADFDLQARNTEAQFDIDGPGAASPCVAIQDVAASDAALDFAVVRIAKVADRAPLTLSSARVRIDAGDVVPMNIIQHPDGQPKRIAIRNNLATASAGDDLRYFTSTLGGSSGSPVFNDAWNVVALHRGSIGSRVLNFQGKKTAMVNLGTRILSILDKLPDALRKDMALRP